MVNKSSQKIFNNSLLYALGTVASKAVGFFLVPIYTYNMSSEEYGIATTIISFVSTFGIVVMLSLRAAMIRFYNEYDTEEKKRFIGTIVTGVLANALLIGSLLILFNQLYASNSSMRDSYSTLWDACAFLIETISFCSSTTRF